VNQKSSKWKSFRYGSKEGQARLPASDAKRVRTVPREESVDGIRRAEWLLDASASRYSSDGQHEADGADMDIAPHNVKRIRLVG
jgi:hypothetical protein